MKANELRVGNYVDYIGEVVTIIGVTAEHPFINRITIDYLEYEEILPIPLTEEILLKCGFEECTDYYFDGKSMFFYDIHKSLENSEFYIYFNENNKICLSIMEEEDIISKSLNIQHLHQLQNLYFALTNEELTINL